MVGGGGGGGDAGGACKFNVVEQQSQHIVNCRAEHQYSSEDTVKMDDGTTTITIYFGRFQFRNATEMPSYIFMWIGVTLHDFATRVKTTGQRHLARSNL